MVFGTKRQVSKDEQLLEALQNVERLAKALIEANQRVFEQAGGALIFYNVQGGLEGLAHWKRFIRENYGFDW